MAARGVAVLVCLLSAAGCSAGDPCGRLVTADVVAHARLAASDTVHDAFPWPIEATDGHAAIRDENPSTSWKIPASGDDGGTVLTLDLMPRLGSPVPLETADMTFTGEFRRVRVLLSESCGEAGQVELAWLPPFEPLDLGGRTAGCIRLSFENDENAALDSLRITGGIPECLADGGGWNAPAPAPITFADSGIIEGFYGVPWSWTERARLIDLMAATGLGTYFYCPKWDEKHRAKWREPYSAEEMALFAGLMAHAGERGVTFSFGISPFIDYDWTGDDDYNTLLSKVRGFTRAGARSVTLLADDIEFETGHPVDGEMGSVHAAAVNRLLDDLRAENPDIVMSFVPTVYSDQRIESLGDVEAYLQAISALDPSVRVMWTGTATSSESMTAQEMETVTALIGRRPLIWDNFWANDGGDGFVGRILLGPFAGRGPDLPSAVAGIQHNPSIQGALTRLTLGTFALYMAAPAEYDAGAAPGLSARAEAEASSPSAAAADRDASTLEFVMALFEGNARLMPGHRRAMALAVTISELLADGSDPSGPMLELLPILARMAAIESEAWHGGIAVDVFDELQYPLRKIRYEGEAGLAVLDAIVDRYAGGGGADYIRAANAAFDQSNSCRFLFGDRFLEELLAAVQAASPRAAGGRRIEIQAPPAGWTAGTTTSWTPVTGEPGSVRLTVFGLPGATVDGTSISWTPAHGGIYKAAVAAEADGAGPAAGSGVFEITVTGEP